MRTLPQSYIYGNVTDCLVKNINSDENIKNSITENGLNMSGIKFSYQNLLFCSSVVRAFAHGAMGHQIDP